MNPRALTERSSRGIEILHSWAIEYISSVELATQAHDRRPRPVCLLEFYRDLNTMFLFLFCLFFVFKLCSGGFSRSLTTHWHLWFIGLRESKGKKTNWKKKSCSQVRRKKKRSLISRKLISTPFSIDYFHCDVPAAGKRQKSTVSDPNEAHVRTFIINGCHRITRIIITWL